ncbi:MAG TPA: transcriptional regulator [Nocardioides sp.]|nr:transcriptional regulator [Nocardioides sp.]
MIEQAPPRRGPRPPRTAAGRPLSATRKALLETLEAQPEATSIPALVTLTGLHTNTVREHLDGLLRSGHVSRRPAAANGRGRPGWLYEAVRRDPGAGAEYAGLAATLAALVVRSSPDPAAEAARAGVDWGHRMARESPDPLGAGEAGAAETADPEVVARRKVVALFDEMGFAPEADDDAGEARLTRCPLLEAAHQQPEVVCSVHLGIVRGALETYGGDPSGAALVPFAEPGACLLHLAPPTGTKVPSSRA